MSLYEQSSVATIVNGTALLMVAQTQLGGGYPGDFASGSPTGDTYTILGVTSADGVKLHRMTHSRPIFTDTRGPAVEDQRINLGVDGFLEFDLFQYDQDTLWTYIEQGAASLDSAGNPTGFGVNIGNLMYDNYNLQNASNLTSCLWVGAPKNLYDGGQHSFIFPRTFVEDDTEHRLSIGDNLSVHMRIHFQPDASGFAYYRFPINEFNAPTINTEITVNIDTFAYSTDPS